MAKRVLIFGGAGFIGRHLQKFIEGIEPNTEVHILDIAVAVEDATHHCLDVRKPIMLELAPAETVIYNLAAIHKTPGHPDHDYFEVNILGAQNVCDFADRIGANVILFSSSIAPYGASEDLKTEESLPKPNTPYGISKLVAEHMHRTWQASQAGRRLAIIRPGIVFGQGEGGNFTRLAKALQKGLFAYAGRRDTKKAGIYVKDLVRIMDLMTKSNRPVQLYNCCFQAPPTIEEIVETMKAVQGVNRRTFLIPALVLQAMAKVLGLFNSVGLGFHPDRVKKLMVSTQISGAKLAQDYPLQYDLKSALEDWKFDCGGGDMR